MKKKLSIYGCTGSIGDSTFKLFKQGNKNYKFHILTGYKNHKKIKHIIKKYKPNYFVVFDEKTYLKLKKSNNKTNVKILNSKDFLTKLIYSTS